MGVRGGGGASPPETEEIFEKSNKMEIFPYSFFGFLARLPKSPNYELTP